MHDMTLEKTFKNLYVYHRPFKPMFQSPKLIFEY